ncbi:helix-turn-helix transcriptional regulator [Longispora sp. K20-0274]|uniref:helix-turn-helix transcriptional regulator n=1 Tax=Longispora sp. K20-0274 TaxID=3088255 RepID=UPI00399A670B
MAALHAAPARNWTVADLAAQASVSRSLLNARFREVLARSPIRYLNEWRMHVALGMLATTDNTIAAIAHTVGDEA